jgi:hypothetical protein
MSREKSCHRFSCDIPDWAPCCVVVLKTVVVPSTSRNHGNGCHIPRTDKPGPHGRETYKPGKNNDRLKPRQVLGGCHRRGKSHVNVVHSLSRHAGDRGISFRYAGGWDLTMNDHDQNRRRSFPSDTSATADHGQLLPSGMTERTKPRSSCSDVKSQQPPTASSEDWPLRDCDLEQPERKNEDSYRL